ncbi:MAG TPA: hypothetical protein P5198_10355, partial [Flexilinea sp.]|nr:hypothetical protein [Flexilinea sp.]
MKKSGKKRSRKISGLCPHPAPLPAGEGIFVGDSVLDIPLQFLCRGRRPRRPMVEKNTVGVGSKPTLLC